MRYHRLTGISQIFSFPPFSYHRANLVRSCWYLSDKFYMDPDLNYMPYLPCPILDYAIGKERPIFLPVYMMNNFMAKVVVFPPSWADNYTERSYR